MINKLKLLAYKKMLMIRLVEEEIAKRYKKQLMRCPIHLSVGQEAAAVGFCLNLKVNDKIYSTHRCHAHYLAKGGNLQKMISEIHGKPEGCCGGRGGSMHLFDTKVGVVSSVPIVGSSIPLAAGSALSDKIDKNKKISAVIFGDAAVEEGVFHETMNFASLYELPIVFVCENNSYSCYTHFDKRQPNRSLKRLAYAHNIKYISAKDHQLESIFRISKLSTDYVRKFSKPCMIEINTYRYLEHCGPNNDDQLNYRDTHEIKFWKQRDPVNYLYKHLLKLKVISKEENEKIINNYLSLIYKNFDKAENSKLPSKYQASKFVYA